MYKRQSIHIERTSQFRYSDRLPVARRDTTKITQWREEGRSNSLLKLILQRQSIPDNVRSSLH